MYLKNKKTQKTLEPKNTKKPPCRVNKQASFVEIVNLEVALPITEMWECVNVGKGRRSAGANCLEV